MNVLYSRPSKCTGSTRTMPWASSALVFRNNEILLLSKTIEYVIASSVRGWRVPNHPFARAYFIPMHALKLGF